MENRADFTIDSSILTQAIEAMDKIRPTYEEAVTKIRNVTEPLIDTNNWKGRGRDEFKEAYRIIDHYLTDDSDKISSLAEMIKGFAEIYRAADVETAKKLYNTFSPKEE